jgi:predicted CXXCH cytochrome family protein
MLRSWRAFHAQRRRCAEATNGEEIMSSGKGWRNAVASSVAVLAIGFSGVASAQIAGTKHNLGTTGTGTNKFSGTGEICVFCHTPHGADTTASAPLWNRTLSGQTYQTYDSLGTTTLDGKTLPVGSVSIACLSCHDGTQAMNAVINAPGSGFAGDPTWQAGTWSGSHQQAGRLTGDAMLGTDLRNDHPIGIQYCGGGQTANSPSGACTDPDFHSPDTALINGNRVWWVDTGGAGRQKTDMILYTRSSGTFTDGTTLTQAQPFVECASCHDPHSANQTFLRVANTGSAVCLACHVK